MKRDLAWYPAMKSTMNHLYDVQTGKTLCGSQAKRKESNRGWGLNYWQNADCTSLHVYVALCGKTANWLQSTDPVSGAPAPRGYCVECERRQQAAGRENDK